MIPEHRQTAEISLQFFLYTDWDDMSPDDEASRRIDPVPANEFLYIGQALTGHEFSLYVDSYNFGTNPPNFVVLHHTAVPYTMAAPAPGGSLNKAWDANEQGMSAEQIKQKRLRQLNSAKEYYRKNLLWDRGPHLFIDDRHIYLFTPMYDVGIHAKQGNSYTKDSKFNYSIGIEVLGHYTNTRWPEPVAQLVGHAIAMLKKRLNTFELVYKPWAGGISGHRDYNKPACPGDAVTNDFIIQAAKEGWRRLTGENLSGNKNILLVWPVPSSKTITQKFGANYNNYMGMGWKIGHSGLDIRTRTSAFPSGIGTSIVAAQDGTVRHAGWHFYANGKPSGYGIVIELDHPDGTRTLYGHLSKVHVKKGQKVSAGQCIGDGGNTGNSTGPHLHFELLRPPFDIEGVWGRVDPTPYFGSDTRSLDDLHANEICFERNLKDAFCNCRAPKNLHKGNYNE